MDERSVRLVKMSLVSQKKNLSKLTKYHYVYAISLIRFISPLINKITIQNYVNKTHSMVDYFLEISEKNMFLFFSLISKNMTYNYEQLINISGHPYFLITFSYRISSFSKLVQSKSS